MQQKHHSIITRQYKRNPQKTTIVKEIQKTLLYSDIFDYPLTGEQVFQYLSAKVSGKKFLSALREIPHIIKGRTFYYFLPKRQQLVEKRLLRERESRKKIDRVKGVIRLLGLIPTIRFVGISGSVALLNADSRSDTDLFFITSKGSVWITRLLVYGVLYLFGILRRNEKNISKSLCVNMYMDENTCTYPTSKRNLYIAHEIAQIMPIINKRNAYEKFLMANKWITDYFPNYQLPDAVQYTKGSAHFFLILIEYIVRKMQLWYMQQKKTREITTKTLIAFHPIDYEKLTLRAYEEKIQTYDF